MATRVDKMPLVDDIRTDLKKAMLEKDKLRISTIRLLISSIHNKEIEKGESLEDEELLAVLSSEVKKRRESAEEYKKGNREDLAEKEEKEIKIIQEYLPEQLSDENLQKIIKETIAQTGATGRKDTGKVMGQLMPKIKGRADGKKASQMVSELLSD